ncbi:bifunctional adenosylcobinamide kinase/adenosylcobinamide-phosphate guanylyltransferase [Furfurilactobacillus sp. WILCCON 0119]
MTELIMVTGGAKSGKSAYAEDQLTALRRVGYVATGVLFQDDAEMARRIKRHQDRRSKTWATCEQYRNVGALLTENSFDGYLIDDATMLTTNLFFDAIKERAQASHEADWDVVIEALTATELTALTTMILAEWHQVLSGASAVSGPVIIVTNEVGLSLVPATKQARVLRDLYGEVNQQIAAAATHVTMVVSGLPLQLK